MTPPVAGRRRKITVVLTQPQMDALRVAIDNHGQFLIDNDSDPQMARQFRSLTTAWSKIEAAWGQR